MFALRSLLCTLLILATPALAAPNVLATLKPVHSLVAGVMAGASTPELLIGGALSGHSYALKPSDARKIRAAALIFEIGPDMETYLSGALANTTGRIVVLEQAPGVQRLQARRGGLWDADHDHDHGGSDPHLWLDPHNAVAMTRAIAAALVAADPVHAGLYRRNADRQIAGLQALDSDIRGQLAPVKDRPYLVFHDAYHYFEARYGLKPAGAVTVAPDRPVGARRVAELRQAIASGRAVCLFREPQFPPKLIEALDDGTKARIGILDPLGADLTPGPDLYPRLMRALAQSLRTCLNKNR